MAHRRAAFLRFPFRRGDRRRRRLFALRRLRRAEFSPSCQPQFRLGLLQFHFQGRDAFEQLGLRRPLGLQNPLAGFLHGLVLVGTGHQRAQRRAAHMRTAPDMRAVIFVLRVEGKHHRRPFRLGTPINLTYHRGNHPGHFLGPRPRHLPQRCGRGTKLLPHSARVWIDQQCDDMSAVRRGQLTTQQTDSVSRRRCPAT